MRLFGFDISRTEQKASAAYAVNQGLPAPRWMTQDYRAFSTEGYQKNLIVYQAIKARAEAVKQVKWTVWNGEREIVDGDIVQLLRQPNPMQTMGDYLDHLISYWCISGNRYQERVRVGAGGPVREMYILRPDRMKIITGNGGMASAYEYQVGGRKHRFEVDPVTLESDILHEKTFSPLDDWYGMSPMCAGTYAINIHNEAMSLAKSLMQNSARPSGAIVHNPKDGGSLSDENYNRLKAEMEANYQGSANAGRPMLLEGGLEWQAMGLSPKDAEALETRFASARDICLTFGVPPLIIGIPGDNTYANLQEANRQFWEKTVIPDALQIANGWTRFIGDGLEIRPDFDHIPTLMQRQAEKMQSLQTVDFLTPNEKRELCGFEPLPEGNTLTPSNPEPQLTADEAKAIAYGFDADKVVNLR